MFTNPMRAILSFAENRGKDADILTNRLNQVFGPMAEQLIPASAPGGFSLGESVAPPPQAASPVPFSPPTGLAAATIPNAVDTSEMMVLGEITRGGQQMLMLRAPDGSVTYQPKDTMPSAQVGQNIGAGGELSGGLPEFADFTPPAMASAPADIDTTYRNVADALGVSVSTSGTMAPTERRDVESMFGAILNEVIDPESAIEADKRNRVADLFTGLGIGFGQMSRGDRVDLSEVRTAAAQRQREQTILRMERAKRAAGASYAMELGDEGLARAIAGGAADINTLLTKRQQDIVNDRANAAILREAQQNGLLATVLAEDGGFSPTMVEAIRGGANPAAVLKIADQRRVAALAAESQQKIEDSIEGLRSYLEQNEQSLGPIEQEAFQAAMLDNFSRMLSGEPFSKAYLEPATARAAELRQQAATSRDTSDIQNYEFYAEQETDAGREPMTFEQFRQARPAGVSVRIDQPQPGTPAGVHPIYGPPPSDNVWSLQRDDEGNVMGSLNAEGAFVPLVEMEEGPDGRMRPVSVPIAGGVSAEREAARIAEAEASIAEAKARQERGQFLTQTILSEVDQAFANLDAGMLGGLLETSGLAGTLAALIPGTEAADLAALIESLQGATALEQLSILKEATGAGLGNVTEKQLFLLSTAFGALRQATSGAQLRRGLSNVANLMTDITFGAGNPYRYDERGQKYTPGADTFGLTPASFDTYIQTNDPEVIVPLIENFARARNLPPQLSEDAFQALPRAYQQVYLDTVARLLGEE